jgi:hypothetical protein
VTDHVEQTRTDWMAQLVRSVTSAGLAQTVRAPAIGVPDDSAGDTPGDTAGDTSGSTPGQPSGESPAGG